MRADVVGVRRMVITHYQLNFVKSTNLRIILSSNWFLSQHCSRLHCMRQYGPREARFLPLHQDFRDGTSQFHTCNILFEVLESN